MAAKAPRPTLSRWCACLTIAGALVGCAPDDDASRDTASSIDTLAPVGSGTERLLTEERLALLAQWIESEIERTGRAPATVEDIAPPDSLSAQYVPVDRYLRDGWGRYVEYSMRAGPRSWELRSSGADGMPRTPDDVVLRSP